MTEETAASSSLELATELTIAWLGNPNTRAAADDVPAFLERMHSAVTNLANAASGADEETAAEYTPAVTVRKSLASKDHIISMIDGKPYKMLRRHLSGNGLTPEQYRERYNLRSDYPMVAESYAQTRRDLAKRIGLGRKPGQGALSKAASANASKSAARPPKAAKAKPAPQPAKPAPLKASVAKPAASTVD